MNFKKKKVVSVKRKANKFKRKKCFVSVHIFDFKNNLFIVIYPSYRTIP